MAGQPVALIGCNAIIPPYTPAICGASSQTKFFVGVVPAVVVGDAYTVPHINTVPPFDVQPVVQATGSPKFFVGGKPVARLGDTTSFGSTIAGGTTPKVSC